MATATEFDLAKYCTDVASRARRAAARMATVGGEVKANWLRRSAALIRERRQAIGRRPMPRTWRPRRATGSPTRQIDRLRLTPARIESMAVGLEEVAALPEPIGELIDSTLRPNGLRIDKVRVPLGVVFFIYESRPNVTADAAAICVKAGNAVILRGGKEAIHSSQAIVELLAEAAAEVGLPADAVQLVSTTDREPSASSSRCPNTSTWRSPAAARG